MIYLDASALVTLISGRPFAAELRAFLATWPATPMATSTLGFVETVRTLDRLGTFPGIMDDLDRDFTEILLTEEVRDSAARWPGGVRTLDAIHLASAEVLGEALDVLVTYDKRMLDLARSNGMPGVAPGLE